MTAFANNFGMRGFWDSVIGPGAEQVQRAQIADGIAMIPRRAQLIGQYRAQLNNLRGARVNQDKLQQALGQLDTAERSLQALDGMTRLAWKAAYRAGKVADENPPQTEMGLSGVFAYVAIGVAAAAVIAVFVVSAPFVAALSLVVGALSAVAAIVSLLTEDNAKAMAARQPGDPPVPSVVASSAGTAVGLSSLPLLAMAGIAAWFLMRRRAR